MPRVTMAVARKDYPNEGIKKGDVYYSWSFYRQPVTRSLERPRQSQLTNNKMSGAYAAMEALEDALAAASCPADVESALSDASAAINDVVSEYDESISNLEQAFPGGSPVLEEHQEKRDGLEQLANAMDASASAIGEMDASDYADDVEDAGKTIAGYDDLSTVGQEAMLDDAKEKAAEHSIDF